MDEIRAAFGDAFKVYDKIWSTGAEAQQMPPGNILVTYRLPIGAFARAVSIHIDSEVIGEAGAGDQIRLTKILGNAKRILAGRMASAIWSTLTRAAPRKTSVNKKRPAPPFEGAGEGMRVRCRDHT